LGRIGVEAIPALEKAVRHHDTAVRKAAAETLGVIGPDASCAIPTFVKVIDDKRADEQLRVVCAEALGRIGVEAVPALEKAVRQQDPGVRKAAATALGVIGPDASSAIPTLVSVFDDKDADEQLRVVCTRALGRIGVEAVPALGMVVRHQDSGARVAAARALRSIGPEAATAIPSLVRVMQDESEEMRLREACAYALGRIGSEALPALEQAVRDLDSDVRAAAATALRDGEAISALPVLAEILTDRKEEPTLRSCCARRLGRMGPRAISGLMPALGDTDPIVVGGVCQALRGIGVEAVPTLIDALRDQDTTLRVNAACALGGIGPESDDAILALRKALDDAEPKVRVLAFSILLDIDENDSFPQCVEDVAASLLDSLSDKDTGSLKQLRLLLQDPYPWVRGAAAQAVSMAGSRALPKLVELLDDQDATIRRFALYTLGCMGSEAEPATPRITNLLQDQDPLVRQAAADALAKIRPNR